jgi:hypothetical protein
LYYFLLGALYLAAFAPALVIAAEPVIQRHCPKEGLPGLSPSLTEQTPIGQKHRPQNRT